jgi:integrase
MKSGPKMTPETPNSGPKVAPDMVAKVAKLPPRPDRPSPFGVRWWSGGKRLKQFFKTEVARDDKYDSLVKATAKGNPDIQMSGAEIRAYRAFLGAVGATPWQDVVAGWREHLRAAGRVPCDKSVADAATEFNGAIDARLAAGDLSKGYHCHIKQKVGIFADTFGANRLDGVTAEDIEEWIDDLGFEANGTFNMYRKAVRTMYQHFGKLVKNPCDDIPARSETIGSVAVLTIQQTAQLFAYAQLHHKDALGRLALEAFAGLRFSSAFRLEKKDINFVDRGILLPAHKMKTGRRHYIDGLPENLWDWLAATNDACWAMESSDWMHLKSQLFTDAKVPHPRNCLRHSFCTYHVAAYKDPGLTSTILCHRNQQKLWSNYRGNSTRADGQLYFTVTPKTAAAMAA